MSVEKIDKVKSSSVDKAVLWQTFIKYMYTLLLLMIHMVYALSYATFGPAFVDLKYILNTSMKWISLFSTVFSSGNILGTFFGLSFKYFNRQLIIVLVLVLMALATTFVPFCTQIWQFYVCALLYGLGVGAWVTANNVWLIEIWQKNSGQVLFLSQLMYGIGAIIGPLIDRPYLTGETDPEFERNKTLDYFENKTNFIDNYERGDKLKTPFIISGAIQISLPVLMLIMYFIHRYKYVEKCVETTTETNQKLFDRSGKPRILLITLMSISLATINSLELVYFNFGSTYIQYTAAKLSAKTAASIMSVLSAAYTGGQAINFFIAMFIKTKYMIGYHFFVSIIAIICLNFVQTSETGLWVLNVVIGFGFSALFPGIFAYMSKYIEISNRIGTIIWFTCGVVNFVPPLILGSYIESNPIVFMSIELIYLLICSLTFVLILVLIKRSK